MKRLLGLTRYEEDLALDDVDLLLRHLAQIRGHQFGFSPLPFEISLTTDAISAPTCSAFAFRLPTIFSARAWGIPRFTSASTISSDVLGCGNPDSIGGRAAGGAGVTSVKSASTGSGASPSRSSMNFSASSGFTCS